MFTARTQSKINAISLKVGHGKSWRNRMQLVSCKIVFQHRKVMRKSLSHMQEQAVEDNIVSSTYGVYVLTVHDVFTNVSVFWWCFILFDIVI